MSEHKRKHDSTTDDYNRARSMYECLRMQTMTPEEIRQQCFNMMIQEKAAKLGQLSGTSFTDDFDTRLPSSIPSGTSMSEHKRKHDSTTDDDNWARLHERCRQQLIRRMHEEISGAKLGQLSGTSFTDDFDTRAMSASMEIATIAANKGRIPPTYIDWNLGADSSVWAPNPSMDNARIVSQLVQLPGGGLLVLCKDRPRVEPHSLQTPADCMPFKVQIAKLSQMPQTVFAGDKLENSDGSPIEVEIIDNRTGSIVSEGLESSAEVTVVVLEGSSGNWIEVKPRDGKPPLLAGCVTVLKEGKGRFPNLRFTDNSSFVRDKKFRLGFKVDSGSHIQGALSTAICVKDARGKSNVKKEIPDEDDTVDVLVHIAKNGAPLHKLNDCGIKTVKQLLLFYEKDPKALRDVLKHMPQKSFEATIKNAKQCPLVLEPASQVSQESKVPLNSSMMAQNQTTTSAGAKEGSAVISEPEGVSGFLMSGGHSKFNVFENQHNLSLGHPQGDHLNPPAVLPMSSHSGETTPKTSAGAKEGNAVISEGGSGFPMSGGHTEFNVSEHQHSLWLGHPQVDQLNPLPNLQMSSHSGELWPVLQSSAFQQLADTGGFSNGTEFGIDEIMPIDNETSRPLSTLWDVDVDNFFSAD